MNKNAAQRSGTRSPRVTGRSARLVLTPTRIVTLIVIGPLTALIMGAAITLVNPVGNVVYPVTPTAPIVNQGH